jgi:bacillithiol biosynthesis cysteine-adding enzyme BshC
MPSDCISYQESGYFTNLIVDYLAQKPDLESLYNRFSSIENFEYQIAEKGMNFPQENRTILVAELQLQYSKITTSKQTLTNINLLQESNTYTVTTGHQLNLFSGPLYFLYKIISTIDLCKSLKQKYPEANFIPIYWMATEDHDFDEINHFQLNGKKIIWEKESFGPVGRLSTSGLEDVYELFANEIGIGENAEYLKQLFKNSYLDHNNLADATRYLANALFQEDGLIILDGDSISLKKLFNPFAKKELLNQTSFKEVSNTIKLLKEYNVQVNPREINLFYIENDLRERIILESGIYKVNNTKIQFTESQILEELNNHPEKFSPNVILRPLYQEVILPNLAYIGGGGELAYWLELKSNFEKNKITFPILVLRNSVVITTKKQVEKADKLNLSWEALFLNQQELFEKKTKENSEFDIDFSSQKEYLKLQFKNLYIIAEKTDKSFLGAVSAQEKKQLKGLDKLEKRLLKAEKRKYADEMERIFNLQNSLFPNQSLQERKENFSSFYNQLGNELLTKLKSNLDPMSSNFTILEV